MISAQRIDTFSGMTIWLLALVLFAGVGAAGYYQGAVRAAISTLGLLVAAVFSVPLAPLVKHLMDKFITGHPLFNLILPPLIVFFLIMVVFKIVGMMVHRKVEVFYKYKASDLGIALWHRLNHRLGACVGLLNGTIYLVLISMLIYLVSYSTVQLASGDGDPLPIRFVNKLGKDLESSGFIKTAAAIAPAPPEYYDIADTIGLVYQNPLIHARLARYPAFLAISEREEFQAIANDVNYIEMLQRREPVQTILSDPKSQAIINNKDLLQSLYALVQEDLEDLQQFLKTGKSPKYDSELILGRWNFDGRAAINQAKKENPNIGSGDLLRLRKFVAAAFSRTSFIATTDKEAILKDAGPFEVPGRLPAPADIQHTTYSGKWRKTTSGDYTLNLEAGGERKLFEAKVEEGNLVILGTGFPLVFAKEL